MWYLYEIVNKYIITYNNSGKHLSGYKLLLLCFPDG